MIFLIDLCNFLPFMEFVINFCSLGYDFTFICLHSNYLSCFTLSCVILFHPLSIHDFVSSFFLL